MGEERIAGKVVDKVPAWVEAEKRVASLLEELVPEGYLVLNDIHIRYGNIDHLVIRPDQTVFQIETKSHQGKVTWDGRRLLLNGRPLRDNYLCQVNRSIRWLRQTAKRIFGVNPWIVAVLVFPNAEVMVKRSVKRVNVLPADRLIEFIRSYRQ